MCDCIERLNESKALKDTNTRIRLPSMPAGIEPRVMLVVERRDFGRHVGPFAVYAAYCPMCGEPYSVSPTPSEEVSLLTVMSERLCELQKEY